jgi:hypothetical protein
MQRILLISMVFLPLMGCGKRHQSVVSGTITYSGQPVNGVMLRLYPTPGPGDIVAIPVNHEGKFHTTNVAPGEYKVVVETPQRRSKTAIPKKKTGDAAKDAEMEQKFKQAYKEQSPPITYPDKYKSILNSDLKCTINEGNSLLTLELKD